MNYAHTEFRNTALARKEGSKLPMILLTAIIVAVNFALLIKAIS